MTKNLEIATQKSTLERNKALDEICKELQLNHIPHSSLADQKNVFLDIIVKSMKSSNEAAQISAARMSTLIVLQLGHDERFCSKLSNLFSDLLRRSSNSPSVNASICTTLAFFELFDEEHTHLGDLMDSFKEIFSGNQSSNGDKSNEESNLLRIKALEAWGLLLTVCSPKEVCSLVKSRNMKDLTEMLHTPNIDFRIACGQVILLVIERGRIHNSSYLESDIPEVCNVIKELVNDVYISKDKRRTQAVKFREILKYLEVKR